MAARPWIFTINTFEVNTQGSHKMMLSIATDTEAKLQAENTDADIRVLHTAFLPVYDSYRQININYDVAAGNHQGETLNVETLILTELPKEIRKWEGAVRNIYVEDSPQERSIFAGKRNPFVQGTYEDRIGAVGSLAARLAADTNAAIRAFAPTVLSFYNLILSARDVQQNKEGLLGLLSDTREQQRILVANELYATLGGLMRKFKADPQQVARFFDLSLLRETGHETPALFTLPPGGTIRVENVPLDAEFINTGTTDLSITNPAGAPVLLVSAGTTVLIEQAFIPTIVVHNESATAEGKFSVQL